VGGYNPVAERGRTHDAFRPIRVPSYTLPALESGPPVEGSSPSAGRCAWDGRLFSSSGGSQL
jgi:hypothetical protein